jgi:hypothetical protein
MRQSRQYEYVNGVRVEVTTQREQVQNKQRTSGTNKKARRINPFSKRRPQA